MRLYSEAWRRGWSRAKKQVVLGDGALWIWNLAHQHFPGAVEIVDLYHARQHRWELSAKLLPHDERGRERWTARLLDTLEHGKIEALVNVLRAFPSPGEDLAHLLAKEADSFERNTAPMRYPGVSRARLICRIGSGRGGLPVRDRGPAATLGHVLDGARRQRHSRAALLPEERKVRG